MTNNSTVDHVNTDDTSSNDNPNNLAQTKSEVKSDSESKGLGYEGSIAQSQGISESEYSQAMYDHQ